MKEYLQKKKYNTNNNNNNKNKNENKKKKSTHEVHLYTRVASNNAFQSQYKLIEGAERGKG